MQGTLGVAGAVPSAMTLGDAATITVEGPQPYRSQFRLQMTTSGAGLASNIAQTETYCGSDSSGWSYHRMITAAGGLVTSDRSDPVACDIQTLGGGSSGSSSPGGSTSGSSGSSSGSSTSSSGSSGASSSGSSSGSGGPDGGSSGAGPAPSSGGLTGAVDSDGGRFGGGALGLWPLLLFALAGLRQRR